MIRCGEPPFLECSSRGDKRFSAFYARLEHFNYKTIEEIYQASKIFEDGTTGLHWKQAKGRRPVNDHECRVLYSDLWDAYLDENPHLKIVLKAASGLSDMFGQKGHCCQAEELWRIRNAS